MNEEVQALVQGIREAHIRIGALESMLMLFLGSQSKRDPGVANMLREMAAGEVPDLVPDMPLPTGLSEEQRAQFAAGFEQQKKMTRQYMMQTANSFAEHIKRRK